MPPKEKPKLEPHGEQRAEGKKFTTSDEETNWLMDRGEKLATLRLINARLQPELRLLAVALPRL